jgi:hypothetical protein
MAVQAGATAAAAMPPEIGRESASTTTLDVPDTNTRLLVYSDINARWRCRRRYPGEGENQGFVVGPQLEMSALEAGAEVFDT